MDQVAAKALRPGHSMGILVVRDGVVHLWGTVWSRDQLDAMRIASESIPGVKRVEDHTIPYPIMPGL